jgi:hypothetical protein
VLVHHSPKRTDDQVEQLAADITDDGFVTVVGREGDVVLR